MERNKSTTTVTSDALDTALHGAARYGWREIVEVLLSGRNIRSINLKDSQGKTALHFACAEGHDTVVELLLTLGATVEKDHNDRTALHIAAMKGSKRWSAFYSIVLNVSTSLTKLRWREVLTSSDPEHIAQMQKLVIKMPDVATRFMDQCVTKDGNPDGEDYK
ncbi:Target of rapamycin complex 2 subunit avo2, partial [Desmophyllum pertusum]